MKIRISYLVELTEENVADYRRYHGLTPREPVRDHLRSSYCDVGTMGVDEQMHEGGEWRENDRLLAEEARND